MADDLPDITREDLKRMTPEERIKALKSVQAAKRKRLEDEKKRLEQDISQTSAMIEETEEEAEEEELHREEQIREHVKPQQEEEESLEEMLADVTPSGEDDPYKTGSEYNTRPGGEYNTGATYDPRVGDGNDRMGPGQTPEERQQYMNEHKGREDDKNDDYLMPHEQRQGAKSFLDDMYNR